MTNAVLINALLTVQQQEFAQRYGLICVREHALAKDMRFILQWQHDALTLTDQQQPQLKPFAVAFTPLAGNAARKQLPLAKAMGNHGAEPKRVLDLTAGWGRDAYTLARCGFSVWMCERNPVVAALTEDGLRRLANTEPDIAARLQLCFTASEQKLAEPNLAEQFEVIYLDPMYPEDCYRGQVKKAAQLLRELNANDKSEDAAALLAQARTTGCRRVVVKRPSGAPPLGQQAPHHQILAKTIRFDVYC